MPDRKPLVSIGMPIYNGADVLRGALESLLGQDYGNVEVIISDNDSTDLTREICLDYLARDHRIRYHRNNTNIGATRNFNRVFELSQGEYFMWHAHDDHREPNYISSCLNFMEDNPNVILCCTGTLLCENGVLRPLQGNFSTMGMSVNKRFRKVLWNNSAASIYGLIRSSALRKTGLFGNTIGSDIRLLAELSLTGEIQQLPLSLLRKRIRSGNILKKVKILFEAILPNDPQATLFPFTKLAIELWKMIQKSQLRGQQKMIAFLDIIICFFLKYKVWVSDPVFTVYLRLGNKQKAGRNLAPPQFFLCP